MREERKETLQKLCLVFRNKLIDLLYSVQTGHPGGSLSCTEILTALYYELMDVDPMNPEKEDRDHLILSRGTHALSCSGPQGLLSPGGVKEPAPDGKHAPGPSLRT